MAGSPLAASIPLSCPLTASILLSHTWLDATCLHAHWLTAHCCHVHCPSNPASPQARCCTTHQSGRSFSCPPTSHTVNITFLYCTCTQRSIAAAATGWVFASHTHRLPLCSPVTWCQSSTLWHIGSILAINYRRCQQLQLHPEDLPPVQCNSLSALQCAVLCCTAKLCPAVHCFTVLRRFKRTLCSCCAPSLH